MRFNEMLEGTKAELAVKIFGDDYDVLEKLAGQIKDILEKTPGVAQVEWLLQQKQVTAPVAGVIQELYVRQGEFATAGSTTMTILHTGSLRVRFFVPNDLRPQFMPGATVNVAISGCDQPVSARISRVSARPEYTQPMMFSHELRDRLSFLTEARLEAPAGCTAPPGTPVGVRVSADTGAGKSVAKAS